MWEGSNFWYDANSNGIEDPGERLYNHGWDILGNDNDPIDGGWHGTPVAGIVAGDGTGGKLTGVAPDAQLMIIRCVGSEGDMMEGFQWIFDMTKKYGNAFKPKIITMSASIKFYSKPSYEAWRRLCYNNVLALSIAHTNSIGNQGDETTGGCNINNNPYGTPIPFNIATPGNVPPAWLHPDQPDPLATPALDGHVNSVIACGATNSTDIIWDYSGKGPSAWENIQVTYPCQKPIDSQFWDYRYNTGNNPLIKPDVSAPSGDGMYSTSVDGGYYYFSGTSAATPHVAGTIALMLSANPSLTPYQVSQILQETAIDLGVAGKDNLYGAGRINAYKAVFLSLAYSNKSIDDFATSLNNQRALVGEIGSGFHLVFSSGGQIFYRKSNYNGSAWILTKRLSQADGCKYPAITKIGNTIISVWQEQNGSNYNVVFSRNDNNGTNWSTPQVLPQSTNISSLGEGPVPAIVSNTSGKFLVVYRQSSGLKFTYSTNYGQNWTNLNAVPYTNNATRRPSLTLLSNGDFLLTYDNENSVYTQSSKKVRTSLPCERRKSE